jgi:hypothetical protein
MSTRKPRRKQRKQPRRETLVVIDAASPVWTTAIAEMVAHFTTLPVEGMPELRYQRGSTTPGRDDLEFQSAVGMDHLGHWDARPNTIVLNDTMGITHPLDAKHKTVCHELMHALALVGDCYGCNPDSCVHGTLSFPGGADIEMLRVRYRKKDRR